MSDTDTLHGLTCPRCGGTINIPEGQAIILCPYCNLSSIVSGERGVRRYQVPNHTNREQALQAYHKFLSGNVAIASNTARTAVLKEAMLVYLPFWTGWGRGLGWTFGREKVGSGDHTHLEPREVKTLEELNWNAAACDVGEFGVPRISLTGRPLEGFRPDELHRSGLVFEAVGSPVEATEQARAAFENELRSKANLHEITQSFVRILRPRFGLVYYPLWVVRYLYRERAFQVTIDGFSGEVLYGKAPGNVLYRAGVLVGGMAAGSFLGVTLPGLIISGDSHGDSGKFAIAMFLGGMALMYFSYRRFRYGEHYEYRRYKETDTSGFSLNRLGNVTQAVEMFRDIQRRR